MTEDKVISEVERLKQALEYVRDNTYTDGSSGYGVYVYCDPRDLPLHQYIDSILANKKPQLLQCPIHGEDTVQGCQKCWVAYALENDVIHEDLPEDD